MTTNRMGLTPEQAANRRIDDEELEALIELRIEKVKYCQEVGLKNQIMVHQAMLSALNELLAHREASKEPVFFIEIEGDDWIQAGRIPGSTFDFNNLPDGINHLYAAPPLQAVTVPDGWIKCGDRMPESSDAVLVCQEGGIIFCAEFDGGEFYPDEFPNVPKEGRDITHWMPLPIAPQPERLPQMNHKHLSSHNIAHIRTVSFITVYL